MKNNQLRNGSLIFFLIIIGSLIFSAITHKIKGYKENNLTILKQVKDKDLLMSYLELTEVLSKGKEDFLFIDLRTPEFFNKGHIKNAVNIPFDKLNVKDNIKLIRNHKSKKVVYADSQNKSALALLMLRSSGIDSIRLLPGSYDVINNNIITKTNPSFYFYNDEKARWDYKRQMGGSTAKAEQSAAKIPQQMEIKTPVKGGC